MYRGFTGGLRAFTSMAVYHRQMCVCILLFDAASVNLNKTRFMKNPNICCAVTRPPHTDIIAIIVIVTAVFTAASLSRVGAGCSSADKNCRHCKPDGRGQREGPE